MNEEAGVRPWQWIVTIIVIIILIALGVYMFRSKSSTTGVDTGQEPVATDTNPAASLNRIVVSDQYPGNIVYISSVQLAQPGWVVIHKDNNGTPGAIIGSMWFDKGINPGKITLTSPTVEGGTYYAMLHTDDGDKKFDASKDLPIKDANGNAIMKMFHATASATEVKG